MTATKVLFQVGFVFLLFVSLSIQQTCNSLPNTFYANERANLVTLYNVASAAACCDACKTFEECSYYSYVKSSTLDTYKNCLIKSNITIGNNMQQQSNTQYDSGYIIRTISRTTSCSVQEQNFDYYKQDNIGSVTVNSAQQCCESCGQRIGCNYWSLTGNTCYFKPGMGERIAKNNVTSGTVVPTATTPKRADSKRGLAIYNTKSCSDIRLLGNITWAYNWSEDPDALEQCYNELGIQFIPMVWGKDSHPEYIYGKSPDQSNMTPQEAVAMWPRIEAAAAKYGMKISSPSASYGGPATFQDPIDWLDEFFQLCPSCKVDFITTHQYSYDCNAASTHGAITNYRKYNKPIWVTEFSCWNPATSAAEEKFVKDILVLFENDATIEKYSWFGTRTKDNFISLFDQTKSALSPVGVLYAGGPRDSSSSSSSSSSSTSSSPTSSSPSTTSSSPSSSSASSSPSDNDSSASSCSAAFVLVFLCLAILF